MVEPMLKLPPKKESYWRKQAAPYEYGELNKNLEVDVAIVGGGICGLSCAYLLKQAGLKVAVLEKDTLGHGTSGHTTGKVTSQHSYIYSDLAERLGQKTARIYGQANQTAIEQIEHNIKAEKIDCGWQRDDHYIYTTDPGRVRDFKKEAQMAASLGLPASYEKSTPLPFKVKAAVKFAGQAKFNAQAYINGLAKAVNGKGSFVFENSRIISFRDGAPAHVATDSFEITAKDIIVATNVPTFPLAARLSYCILEYPTTSYIVAAKTKQKFKGMYISPDEDNYSIYPISMYRDNLVLIAGLDHIRGPRNRDKRWQQLANYAEQNLSASAIDYKWSAWDYIAYDDMPVIGKAYPWSKHLYVATAFKKWGLTGTTVAAITLRDLIIGNDNEWAKVFTPHRWSPVKSIPRVMAEHLK